MSLTNRHKLKNVISMLFGRVYKTVWYKILLSTT